MKQCTEKGDDKTKLDTTAINTYGTYMRNFRTRKHLQNLKAIRRKIIFFLDTFKLSKSKIRHTVRQLSIK